MPLSLDYYLKEPEDEDVLDIHQLSLATRLPTRFWQARVVGSMWCPSFTMKKGGHYYFIWKDVKEWIKKEMSINRY